MSRCKYIESARTGAKRRVSAFLLQSLNVLHSPDDGEDTAFHIFTSQIAHRTIKSRKNSSETVVMVVTEVEVTRNVEYHWPVGMHIRRAKWERSE